MRKQYFFVPSERGEGYDAWDVDRLVDRSRGLAVVQVPVASIRELDTAHWFDADGAPFTVRVLARHMRLVHDVDPSYPIILGSTGEVMDGMHRVVRALLEGRETIAAVRFDVQPPPDHRNVHPNELSYVEEVR